MSDFDADAIAKSIVEKWYRGPYPLHHDHMQSEITDISAALRAAEARGLARAAQVAEDFDPNGPASPWDVADLIARAIRALRDPSP